MITSNQLIKKGRIKKTKIDKTPALVVNPFIKKKPQVKGFCNKVMIRTPKKPNSALRKLAKLKIYSTKHKIDSYIPGIGHNIKSYSVVLMRGGRVPDLPGIKYKCIRGKYDLLGVLNRHSARSKYGSKDI